jgi:hypothetical protein
VRVRVIFFFRCVVGDSACEGDVVGGLALLEEESPPIHTIGDISCLCLLLMMSEVNVELSTWSWGG